MQHLLPVRTRPPSGNRLTLGTFILAAAAAVSLVMMSGCHATPSPPSSGFAATSAEKARDARLVRPVESMKPLQPFDEQFVVVDEPAAP